MYLMVRIDAVKKDADATLLAALQNLLPQLNPGLPLLTMERLQAVIADPAVTLHVVRERDDVIGMAALIIFTTPAYVKARIEDVVVDEGARGRGVGEKLVRRCIEVARERGAQVVELQSARRREVANRLYTRLGFELRDSNLYRLSL
jgi:ribosomal protein S18 acetylase RimI-like enzyme